MRLDQVGHWGGLGSWCVTEDREEAQQPGNVGVPLSLFVSMTETSVGA